MAETSGCFLDRLLRWKEVELVVGDRCGDHGAGAVQQANRGNAVRHEVDDVGRRLRRGDQVASGLDRGKGLTVCASVLGAMGPDVLDAVDGLAFALALV